MRNDPTAEASKKLSWLLRHGANESRLPMDAAGWARVDDVLRVLRMNRAAFDDAVANNNKSRLQLDGDRVRACQGHSRAGMPVTLEALEASWEVYASADTIWHGTFYEAVASIARQGILPGERTHVHLAEETDSKVGKRHNVHVLLEVCPERLRARGLGVFRSPNGVLLTREIPPACVVGLEAVSTYARARTSELRALFGLAAA